MMFRKIPIVLFAVILACTAMAEDEPIDLVAYVKAQCQEDLNSYCSSVTPGNRRLLACLYAHENKIQTQCTTALFEAAIILEVVFSQMKYVAHECKTDINEYCADIAVGEGRIARCLKSNEANVSDRCKVAFNENFEVE